MPNKKIDIQTADGVCRAYMFTPESGSKNKLPAVIFYMDAFGIRPALFDMAQRLANMGYVVALPDVFYRLGEYSPLIPREVFKGDFMSVIGPMMSSTDNHRAARDSYPLIEYLSSRQDTNQSVIGTFGLCMGGGMAITTAGFYPEKVAAVASFHAGNLATDAPTSPHFLAKNIKAELYVAGADCDDTYPPEMAAHFRAEMERAGVNGRYEIYKDALHGFMKPDFPVFNAQAAERGWNETEMLFSRTLI